MADHRRNFRRQPLTFSYLVLNKRFSLSASWLKARSPKLLRWTQAWLGSCHQRPSLSAVPLLLIEVGRCPKQPLIDSLPISPSSLSPRRIVRGSPGQLFVVKVKSQGAFALIFFVQNARCSRDLIYTVECSRFWFGKVTRIL